MKGKVAYRPLMALTACAAALLACETLGFGAATATQAPAPTLEAAAPAVAATDTSSAPPAPAAATATNTPNAAPTNTVAPISSLQGTVLQLSNCRYGPGAFYLYKIGLKAGAPVEVIGRTIDGAWAYVQYVGSHNPCWINSKLIQLTGDIMSLQDYYPDKAPLSMATKYGPVSVLNVSGGGGSITVSWSAIALPGYAMPDAGAGEMQYVVEVWSCTNGNPGFYALGTNDTSIAFNVDNSCGQVPHADIVAQNKAGVSGITQITLP
jgi:hypothetical protein